MIVPTPMVTASLGTSSIELKKRALSRRVSSVRALSRVRLASDEPGSLKSDMAVAADAQQLQINSTGRLYGLLVLPSVLKVIIGQSAGHVAPRGTNVYVAEEIGMHKMMVRLRMVRCQATYSSRLKLVA